MTTREKGTGLGLAIVGKILEEHGGGIELHDAAEKIPGQRGAWMRLRFAADPIAATHQRAEKTSNERAVRMASDILIVDDEADIRELVSGILEDEGYTTRVARDSDDALARDRKRAGRAWSFSTSGCRAAGSTGCRCSATSRPSIPTCRW